VIALQWHRREPPLQSAAVAAQGTAAKHLCAGAVPRLRAGTRLRAVADEHWVVIVGDAHELPWADGAVYLGWEAGTLVPTTVMPFPPTDIVTRSVGHAVGELVVLLPGTVLVSTMPVQPADPELLANR